MSRVALVTGGTRGIGRAISQALHADGHMVAAVYRGNEEAASAFQRETRIATYRWDVADFDACRAGIAKVEAAHGAIDILVNNAGVTRDVMLHKMTLTQWNEVMRANLDSVFNMCRHVIEGMRMRRHGRIINISSINGQKGQAGQANYAATKSGILGFTRSLALESAHRHITVNAVAPGYVDTDMLANVPRDVLKTIANAIPIGRLGKPEDVAHVVAFLARDESDFITGSTFSVNGGQWNG